MNMNILKQSNLDTLIIALSFQVIDLWIKLVYRGYYSLFKQARLCRQCVSLLASQYGLRITVHMIISLLGKTFKPHYKYLWIRT